MKLQLIRAGPLYARQGTGWCIGVIALSAADASGAVRWLVKKWIPVHAKTNAPVPHMGAASIPNQRGMSAFTHQLPGAHGNTKKFITTAHPANG